MAIQLGSAYAKVTLDAKGVKTGATQAKGALLGLEKEGKGALNSLGLAVGGVGVVLGAVAAKSSSLAKDFQSSVTQLELAVGDVGLSFDTLHSAAITVGGDTRLLGVSASGASEALTGLYKNGLSTAVIFGDLNGYLGQTAKLGGVLRASIDMAAATELDMVRASELATTTLSMFGRELETDAEKAEFATWAMDQLVRVANASNNDVSDLAAALGNVGPQASQMGFSLEDTTNALALMSSWGIKGAEAGTALKSMLLNLNRPTDAVTEALDDLNISLYNSRGEMYSLPEILQQLEGAFSTLTEEEKNFYYQTLAGSYGIKAMSTLVEQGTEAWDDMADATENATSMQEQAERMSQTLEGRLEALGGNVETLMIQIGEELNPVLSDWVEWLIRIVDEHGPAIIEVVGKIAEAFLWISDGLQGEGGTLQNMIVQFGLAGIAAQGLGTKLSPLISVVGKLPELLGNAGAAAQLLAEGNSLASVASTTLLTVVNPLTAALLAFGAALLVYKEVEKFKKAVAEGNEDIGDKWVKLLQAASEEMESATAIAEAYAKRQSEMEDIYNSLDSVERKHVDAQKVMNADLNVLVDTLIVTATSYEDYLEAVELINEARLVELETGEKLPHAYKNMIDPLDEAAFRTAQYYKTLEDGTPVAEDAAGDLDELNGEMSEAELAALELAQAQEEMAQRSAEAWATFKGDVSSAIGQALEAYRTGNAGMLKEQQNALARSMVVQIAAMQSNGEISSEQAREMKSAIIAQYGILLDETQVASDAFVNEWNRMLSGEITMDQLLANVANLGEVAEEAIQTERDAIADSMRETEIYAGVVAEYGGSLGTSVEEGTKRAGAALDAYGNEVEGLPSVKATEVNVVQTGVDLGALNKELAELPTEKIFTMSMVDATEDAIETPVWPTFEMEFGPAIADLGVFGQNVEELPLEQSLVLDSEEASAAVTSLGDMLNALPDEHHLMVYIHQEGSLPQVPDSTGGSGTGSAWGEEYGYNARGTDYWKGGLTWVGEEGPELVDLPVGAQVFSAQESVELMRSMSTAQDILSQIAPVQQTIVNIEIPVYEQISSDVDINDLAYQLVNIIKEHV